MGYLESYPHPVLRTSLRSVRSPTLLIGLSGHLSIPGPTAPGLSGIAASLVTRIDISLCLALPLRKATAKRFRRAVRVGPALAFVVAVGMADGTLPQSRGAPKILSGGGDGGLSNGRWGRKANSGAGPAEAEAEGDVAGLMPQWKYFRLVTVRFIRISVPTEDKSLHAVFGCILSAGTSSARFLTQTPPSPKY